MGRALIDTPERWRAWLQSGLSHVLGPLPGLENLAGARSAACEPKLTDFALSPDAKGLSEVEKFREGASVEMQLVDVALARSEREKGASGAEPFRNAPRAARAKPEPAFVAAKSASFSGGGGAQRALPADSWPEAWRAVWKKTVFARPFLWSYAHLGHDLLGAPSPERREVLQRLFLQLDLGSVHNFWPFSEPDAAGELRLQPVLFREGVKSLAPRCVIFLGREAFKGVTLPETPELYRVTSYLSTGVFCIHLPSVQDLGADAALLAEAVATVKQKLIHLI